MTVEKLQDCEQRIEKLADVLGTVAAELTQLRQDVAEASGKAATSDLARCITALDALGLLGTSREADDLLDTIVAVATKSTHAEGGSLLLVTDDRKHLVFEAVHGEKADDLAKLELEMGQGIAGFVATTGQPLCVADVAESEQWDRSISEAIQFETQSILAVPVMAGARIVGVLEVVNKMDSEGFEQADIELLSQFARIAGAAVDKRDMMALSKSLLVAMKERPEADDVTAELTESLEQLQASDAHRQAMEMAVAVETICAAGPNKARTCAKVIAALSEFVSSSGGPLGFEAFQDGFAC